MEITKHPHTWKQKLNDDNTPSNVLFCFAKTFFSKFMGTMFFDVCVYVVVFFMFCLYVCCFVVLPFSRVCTFSIVFFCFINFFLVNFEWLWLCWFIKTFNPSHILKTLQLWQNKRERENIIFDGCKPCNKVLSAFNALLVACSYFYYYYLFIFNFNGILWLYA